MFHPCTLSSEFKTVPLNFKPAMCDFVGGNDKCCCLIRLAERSTGLLKTLFPAAARVLNSIPAIVTTSVACKMNIVIIISYL